MIPDTSLTPPLVTFRRNLRSLAPSRLSAMVSSSLPPLKQLSSLDANSANDTFCFTLMSCFDTFCPLYSGQHVPLLLPLGYLLFSANIVLNSGLQKGYGANHKILLTLIYIDHSSMTSLLMSPLLKGHTIMTKLTICLILACSLKHFPPSFVLPLLQQLTTLPHSSLMWEQLRRSLVSLSPPSRTSTAPVSPAKPSALQVIPPTRHTASSVCCHQGGDCGVSRRGPADWRTALSIRLSGSWTPSRPSLPPPPLF